MVASLNAAAKSDWAHESDVLLAWHQTDIWTAAYKESFLSILRAVWTELEYCSYFPLWFISLRHLRVLSVRAAKPQAWTNPLHTVSDFWWEIPKQGKSMKRGQKLVVRTEREKKRESREINAGDLSKFTIGKERRYQEVQSQLWKDS